ncbi:MAG: MarR family transcriptional regulator [Bryobacteraceae bacterium]
MPLQFIPDLHRISSRLAASVASGPTGELPIADLLTLSILCDNEKFTVAGLQEQLGFAPSTVSSILNRLERRKLIERQSSVKDRRTFHVSLTQDGVAAARGAREFLESLEDRLTSQLSYAHVIAFSEVVEALDKTLRPNPLPKRAKSATA